MAYICSKIKPGEKILEYEFDISTFCRCCGINCKSGKNYNDIKESLKKLSDRSMWLRTEDSDILVRFLDKVKINKKSGKVYIRIDEDLTPYLFDLQEKFTHYHLHNILAMKSAFSIRIYELMHSYLHSYLYQKNVKITLDSLKEFLLVSDVKSYKNFNLFKTRVLDIAKREINELTDITIDYTVEKSGNKVIAVNFVVERKRNNDILSSALRVHGKLDKEN